MQTVYMLLTEEEDSAGAVGSDLGAYLGRVAQGLVLSVADVFEQAREHVGPTIAVHPVQLCFLQQAQFAIKSCGSAAERGAGHRVAVSAALRQDMRWWEHHLQRLNGDRAVPLVASLLRHEDLHIFLDARGRTGGIGVFVAANAAARSAPLARWQCPRPRARGSAHGAAGSVHLQSMSSFRGREAHGTRGGECESPVMSIVHLISARSIQSVPKMPRPAKWHGRSTTLSPSASIRHTFALTPLILITTPHPQQRMLSHLKDKLNCCTFVICARAGQLRKRGHGWLRAASQNQNWNAMFGWCCWGCYIDNCSNFPRVATCPERSRARSLQSFWEGEATGTRPRACGLQSSLHIRAP